MNIQKKFIGADQVDDSKTLLSNNAFLRARNAANNADINLIKLNASDAIEFASVPQYSGSPFVTQATVTGSAAAKDLSNLTATAINQDLLPDTTNTRNLGSAAKVFTAAYAGSLLGADSQAITMINSVAAFQSLSSTATAATTGGSHWSFAVPTGTFAGNVYAYVLVTTSNVVIQVINLTTGAIVQEFTTALPSSFFPGGAAVSVFANMLYLDDADLHSKAAFSINPANGQITGSASPTMTWSGSEGGMTVSADGKVLVFSGNSGTQSFTVASNGNLTAANTQAGSGYSWQPKISPAGTWLITGSVGYGNGQIMSLNPTTGILGSPSSISGLTRFAISPDGKHIYDASGKIFSLNETTGAVVDTGNTWPTLANGGRNSGTPVAVSDDGATVFSLNLSGVVASYSRNSTTGALTLISSSLISSGNSGSLGNNIRASTNVILVASGFNNSSSPPTKAYLFASAMPATIRANHLQIQDGTQGTAGYVWTSTDAIGSGAWMSPTLGANTTLSNLGTTSINANLIPAGNGAINLGQNFNKFGTLSVNVVNGSAAGVNLSTGDSNNVFSDAITGLNSFGTGDIGIWTTLNATANANPTTGIVIATGSKTAGTGNSGDIRYGTGNSVGGNSGGILLQIGTAGGTRGKIQFKDGSEGTSGYVWTSTDINGSGAWAAAAATGANTTLSNLGTTSINADLFPSVAATRNLGSSSLPWLNEYVQHLLFYFSGSQYGSIDSASGNSLSMPSGNAVTVKMSTNLSSTGLGIHTTASGIATGNLYLETGNSLAGNSGGIWLQTGTATGGTRGKLRFRDGTEGTSGYVWMSSDTVGTGGWAALSAANTTLSNLTSSTAVNQDLITPTTYVSYITTPTLTNQNYTLPDNGTRYAQTFTTGAAGVVAKMDLHVYTLQQTSGNIKLGLYANNAGSPGTLLGYSNDISIAALPAFTGGQLVTATWTAPISLSASTLYWWSIETSTGFGGRIGTESAAVGTGSNTQQAWNGSAWSGPGFLQNATSSYTMYSPTGKVLGSLANPWYDSYLKQVSLVSGANRLILKAPSLSGDTAWYLPSGDGSANQVLKTDGAGNLGWATISSGANTALSNLASTALNVSIVPGATGVPDLGSVSKYFGNAYIGKTLKIYDDPGYSFSMELLTGSDTAPSGTSVRHSIRTANGNAMAIYTANQSATVGDLRIETGNSSGGNSGNLILQTGTAAGTRGKIQFKDGSEGTAGYVWTSTDTSGNGHWAAAGASGANTSLSNLTSTAVNTNLNPDGNNTRSLGGSSTAWINSYITRIISQFSPDVLYTGLLTGVLSNRTGLGIGTYPEAFGVSVNPLWVTSGDDTTNNAIATADINIRTGDKTAGTGNSGSLLLKIGTSSGGTRGKLKIQDGSEGTAGYVWTSTDTSGSGNWAAPIIPTLSVVSAYSNTLTPSGSSIWHTVTNNSITLPAGTWELSGIIFLGAAASTQYTAAQWIWAAANGANTGTVPASISTATGVTILGGTQANANVLQFAATDNSQINPSSLVLTLTQSTTVYLVPYSTQSTSSNARIIVNLYGKKIS